MPNDLPEQVIGDGLLNCKLNGAFGSFEVGQFRRIVRDGFDARENAQVILKDKEAELNRDEHHIIRNKS